MMVHACYVMLTHGMLQICVGIVRYAQAEIIEKQAWNSIIRKSLLLLRG